MLEYLEEIKKLVDAYADNNESKMAGYAGATAVLGVVLSFALSDLSTKEAEKLMENLRYGLRVD